MFIQQGYPIPVSNVPAFVNRNQLGLFAYILADGRPWRILRRRLFAAGINGRPQMLMAPMVDRIGGIGILWSLEEDGDFIGWAIFVAILGLSYSARGLIGRIIARGLSDPEGP